MAHKELSVIGLGYGDEGKGTVVDFLCEKYKDFNTLVIRHSGGHQVGHTVKIGDVIHEFRHFGSGTFRGVPTYWSEECTIFPFSYHIEYVQIEQKMDKLEDYNGWSPTLLVNPKCPITTVYDVAYNRARDKFKGHGSVGMGYGATIVRSEKLPLYAFTLKHEVILNEKLEAIEKYYTTLSREQGFGSHYTAEVYKLKEEGFTNEAFLESCRFLIENVELVPETIDLYDNYDIIINEGNQGVLLDKYHGIFPHVTYGHTTNKNVGFAHEIYYVTRAYTTRHGAGPLQNNNLPKPIIINNKDESNHLNPWQGKFRHSLLSFDHIKYAIEADYQDFSSIQDVESTNLVITCMDQLEEPEMTIGGVVVPFSLDCFKGLVDNVYTNWSPCSNTIKEE